MQERIVCYNQEGIGKGYSATGYNNQKRLEGALVLAATPFVAYGVGWFLSEVKKQHDKNITDEKATKKRWRTWQY